jgi:hypothetical protein
LSLVDYQASLAALFQEGARILSREVQDIGIFERGIGLLRLPRARHGQHRIVLGGLPESGFKGTNIAVRLDLITYYNERSDQQDPCAPPQRDSGKDRMRRL